MIRSMCADGATWEAIAQAVTKAGFRTNRNGVIERGRRLNVAPNLAVRRKEELPLEEDANRAPLPAGHARTWELLLPGHPYPKPN